MHTRQGGAAHVPIMFFLLLLVMFLGALGFAYVVQTKNGELIKSRDTAKAEAAQLKEQEEQAFRLRLQLGMGQADGLKKYRALRKDRARMMTIQRERALAASK